LFSLTRVLCFDKHISVSWFLRNAKMNFQEIENVLDIVKTLYIQDPEKNRASISHNYSILEKLVFENGQRYRKTSISYSRRFACVLFNHMTNYLKPREALTLREICSQWTRHFQSKNYKALFPCAVSVVDCKFLQGNILWYDSREFVRWARGDNFQLCLWDKNNLNRPKQFILTNAVIAGFMKDNNSIACYSCMEYSHKFQIWQRKSFETEYVFVRDFAVASLSQKYSRWFYSGGWFFSNGKIYIQRENKLEIIDAFNDKDQKFITLESDLTPFPNVFCVSEQKIYVADSQQILIFDLTTGNREFEIKPHQKKSNHRAKNIFVCKKYVYLLTLIKTQFFLHVYTLTGKHLFTNKLPFIIKVSKLLSSIFVDLETQEVFFTIEGTTVKLLLQFTTQPQKRKHVNCILPLFRT
jgi:hypothetical protein